MKITAPIAGRTQSKAKEVSMATFFLQDPKYDLEIHHEDGLNDYPERYCLERHLISPCYQIGC